MSTNSFATQRKSSNAESRSEDARWGVWGMQQFDKQLLPAEPRVAGNSGRLCPGFDRRVATPSRGLVDDFPRGTSRDLREVSGPAPRLTLLRPRSDSRDPVSSPEWIACEESETLSDRDFDRIRLLVDGDVADRSFRLLRLDVTPPLHGEPISLFPTQSKSLSDWPVSANAPSVSSSRETWTRDFDKTWFRGWDACFSRLTFRSGSYSLVAHFDGSSGPFVRRLEFRLDAKIPYRATLGNVYSVQGRAKSPIERGINLCWGLNTAVHANIWLCGKTVVSPQWASVEAQIWNPATGEKTMVLRPKWVKLTPMVHECNQRHHHQIEVMLDLPNRAHGLVSFSFVVRVHRYTLTVKTLDVEIAAPARKHSIFVNTFNHRQPSHHHPATQLQFRPKSTSTLEAKNAPRSNAHLRDFMKPAKPTKQCTKICNNPFQPLKQKTACV